METSIHTHQSSHLLCPNGRARRESLATQTAFRGIHCITLICARGRVSRKALETVSFFGSSKSRSVVRMDALAERQWRRCRLRLFGQFARFGLVRMDALAERQWRLVGDLFDA